MKPDQYRNVYFYHDQVAGGSGYFKKTGRAKAVMVWRGLSIVAYDRTRAQLKRLASRIKADRALFGRTGYRQIVGRGNRRTMTISTGQLWNPPSFGDTFAKISVGVEKATSAALATGLAFRGLAAVGARLREREEELKRKYGPDVFAKAVELAKVTLYSPEQICEMDKALKEGRTLDLHAITPQPAYYWQT